MIGIEAARASIDEEVGRMLAMLRAASDWSVPTRLVGWSVADLARHLVEGQSLQADAWRRLAAGDAGSATADATDGLDRAATLDAIVARHADLHEALGAVDDEAVAVGACAMPYGTLPAIFVLQLATMEAGVHASDLAAALGEDDTLRKPTVDAGATVLAGALPLLGSAGDGTAPAGASVRLVGGDVDVCVVAAEGGSGWAVVPAPAAGATTTIRGSASDVVLFALGRRGVADVDVVGDPVGAERFKAWFPGP
jgi:uncharacterized protein (TIGR03083 family)